MLHSVVRAAGIGVLSIVVWGVAAPAFAAGTAAPAAPGDAAAKVPAASGPKAPKPAAVRSAYFPLAGGAPATFKYAVVAVVRAELAHVGRIPTASAAPFDESAAMFGCAPTFAPCRARICEALGVRELVYGSLETVVLPSPPDAKPGAKPPVALHLLLTIANGRGATLAVQEFDLVPGKEFGKALHAAVKAVLARGAASAHGRVLLSSEPAGAKVFVDGEERGTAPLVLELEAGTHTIDASLGPAMVSRTVELTSKGAELLLDMSGWGAPASAPAADGRPPGAGSGGGEGDGDEPAGGPKLDLHAVRAPAIAAASAGFGLLALGTVFGALTLATHAKFASEVAQLTPPLTEADDLARLDDLDRIGKRGKAFAVLADALFIGGAIALAGGGFLAYRDLRAGGAAKPADAVAARARVALLPGGAAVAVEVAW